jgi:hypothetical protein
MIKYWKSQGFSSTFSQFGNALVSIQVGITKVPACAEKGGGRFVGLADAP